MDEMTAWTTRSVLLGSGLLLLTPAIAARFTGGVWHFLTFVALPSAICAVAAFVVALGRRSGVRSRLVSGTLTGASLGALYGYVVALLGLATSLSDPDYMYDEYDDPPLLFVAAMTCGMCVAIGATVGLLGAGLAALWRRRAIARELTPATGRPRRGPPPQPPREPTP
jgi:hypothetical protein